MAGFSELMLADWTRPPALSMRGEAETWEFLLRQMVVGFQIVSGLSSCHPSVMRLPLLLCACFVLPHSLAAAGRDWMKHLDARLSLDRIPCEPPKGINGHRFAENGTFNQRFRNRQGDSHDIGTG